MHINEPIKAILFDLDGTLMDTDDQTVARVTTWLQRLHIPQPQRRARRLVMIAETPVNALITLLDRLGLDAFLMNLWQRLSGKRRAQGHHFPIIAGVPELLARLHGRYQLAVVTTRSDAEAQAFIAEHQLQHFFTLVVTRNSTRRLKPHPMPILFAATQLQIPVSHCLMVGDTTPDIISAIKAGARSIGVLCGYGSREELEKEGATVVVEHIEDVAAVVERLAASNHDDLRMRSRRCDNGPLEGHDKSDITAPDDQ